MSGFQVIAPKEWKRWICKDWQMVPVTTECDHMKLDDVDFEIQHVPRLELLSTEDILEAIKDGSPSLWRELKVAVNEEDELEIGHLICKMAWEYKQWLKEQGLDVDSTSTPF